MCIVYMDKKILPIVINFKPTLVFVVVIVSFNLNARNKRVCMKETKGHITEKRVCSRGKKSDRCRGERQREGKE